MSNKKQDLKEIETYFKSENSKHAKIGLDLLNEAYFLKNTLERLKTEIEKNDIINEMQQGAYSITRSNPTIKTYNTTLANYQKLMKQITNLLPQNNNQVYDDDFDNFGLD